MATILETVEVTPVEQAVERVSAAATFTVTGDTSEWTLFGVGDVTLQATGPVDAATVKIERSTVEPSDGTGNATIVSDVTGDPSTGGLFLTIHNSAPAWLRTGATGTLGPANSVEARNLANLVAAIGEQQAYPVSDIAPGTSGVDTVYATTNGIDALVITARTAGAAGNSIATAGTIANGSWGAATLASGADATFAGGTLTFTDVAIDTETVTVDTNVYTFVAALTGAAYEVLVGASVTACRDNLLEAIAGVGTASTDVLTASANATDGDTVTVGPYTYTLVDALSSPTAPFEVFIGASATATLANLAAAIISDTGAGTVYGANTPPNPVVTAVSSVATLTVTSIGTGADANLIKVAETSSTLSWATAQLAGATGAGVTFGVGTAASTVIEAAANSTNAIDATALEAGVAGNAIATTETLTNASWGAATLTGAADAVAATGTLTMIGAFANADTVIVGTVTYTMKTALTPTAGEIALAGTRVATTLTGIRQSNS